MRTDLIPLGRLARVVVIVGCALVALPARAAERERKAATTRPAAAEQRPVTCAGRVVTRNGTLRIELTFTNHSDGIVAVPRGLASVMVSDEGRVGPRLLAVRGEARSAELWPGESLVTRCAFPPDMLGRGRHEVRVTFGRGFDHVPVPEIVYDRPGPAAAPAARATAPTTTTTAATRPATPAGLDVTLRVRAHGGRAYCEFGVTNLSDRPVRTPTLPRTLFASRRGAADLDMRSWGFRAEAVEALGPREGRVRLLPLDDLPAGAYRLSAHMPEGFAGAKVHAAEVVVPAAAAGDARDGTK
ncbi:MAG TPA: hypothetical protein VEA69_14180 [Tepidisphaeraceae bacterium]|nr:hypothetical protein [Tepidisphaeraceae bacterium]